MRPFAGLMGNSCNLRVIQYLLPLKNSKFSETDLMEDVGVSKPTIIKVVRMLAEYELIKRVEQKGNSVYYQINRDSPFIALFEDISNLIVQHLLGEEMTLIPKSSSLPIPFYHAESTENKPPHDKQMSDNYWVIGPAVSNRADSPLFAESATDVA